MDKNIFNKFEQSMKQDKNFDKTYFDKNFSTPFGKEVIRQISEIKNSFGLEKWSQAHDILAHSIKFGCSPTVSREFIIDVGDGGDAGIDSFWFDEKTATLYLLQTKLKKIHTNFITEMKNSYSKYIYGDCTPDNMHLGAKVIKDTLKIKNWHAKSVKFIGIQPNINSSNEDIIGWEDMFVSALNSTENKINLTIKEFSISPEDQHKSYLGDMSKNMSIIFKANIHDLVESLKSFNLISQESFFEANVRDDMKKRNVSLKEGIEKTLTKNPEYFELYNNGITIICNDWSVTNTKQITFENPQIINGQQTTRVLLRLSEIIDMSANACIIIKGIRTKDDKLISEIAEYSNTQSAIKKGDLISTTKHFKEISSELIKKKIYLKAKQGDSIKKDIFSKLGYKEIKIASIMKVYAACKIPSDIARAKSGIGKLQIEYISNGTFSKIDLEFINKYIFLVNKRDDFIKKCDEYILEKNMTTDEAKEFAKLFEFGELAIYNLLFSDLAYKKIFDKFYEYWTSNGKVSQINPFKKKTAYDMLGINTKEVKINESVLTT